MVAGISPDELVLLDLLSRHGPSGVYEAIAQVAGKRAARRGKPPIDIGILEQLGLVTRDGDTLRVPAGVSLLFETLAYHGFFPANITRSVAALMVHPRFYARDFEVDPALCFALMPFEQPWSKRIWTKIQNVVRRQSLRCMRADDLYGEKVMEDVWRMINSAGLILAEITGRNANVFYELGVAHTLGKPVVLLCQRKEDIPFDLLGYRAILYEDNADGYAVLADRLAQSIRDYKRVMDGAAKDPDFLR